MSEIANSIMLNEYLLHIVKDIIIKRDFIDKELAPVFMSLIFVPYLLPCPLSTPLILAH